MKTSIFWSLMIGLLCTTSCIKDDFVEDTVEPTLRITTNIDSLAIDSEFQFSAMYLNNIGQEEVVQIDWTSSDDEVILISEDGLARAIGFGTVVIQASYMDGSVILEDAIEVVVGETTVVENNLSEGSIETTSSYALEGDFVYSETSNGVLISFKDNYRASTALPGLYVYLSNNRSSIADALEISAVETFSGAHDYTIDGVSFSEYAYLVYFCKPFNVKVGDGEL